MATTGTEIYEASLVLMDANNDSDTSEYESKALTLINILSGECFLYSDTYEETEGARTIISPITDLDDEVGLDDYICRTVMPYGLAAHLLMDENPSTASYLNQRYYELLAELKRGIGLKNTGSEDISDVYVNSDDGSETHYYNRFSVWGGS